MPISIGIIANPVSGRDVRRVAARGGVSTAEDKRNRISRAVIGAVTAGANHIVAMQEPFNIATGALADLNVDAELEILDVGANVSPLDTAKAAQAMRNRGVQVVITLGGDGTNRTIAKIWPDVTLVPMSTGTNNVFPSLVEPTVAGAAAGLVASGIADLEAVAPRSKMIHVQLAESRSDIALIDAVTLADDFAGNKMPVKPLSLRQLVVSQARPDTIGVSSIVGLIERCETKDDFALIATCGPGGKLIKAPVAPGLYQSVPVLGVQRVDLSEPVSLLKDTVLAFDGDREHLIGPTDHVTARVERDGPRVVNVSAALTQGAERGAFN